MTRALAALLAVAAVAAPAAPALASPRAATTACATPVATFAIEDPVVEQWSPDGKRLAVVWFGRLASTRTVAGYEEAEVLDVLDLATGALRPVDVGTRPQWSSSGRYLAYWGPFADEVRVWRDGRVVARLEPRLPGFGWRGDTLLFVRGVDLMAWSEDAGVRAAATFPAELAPVFPSDDLTFNSDGTRLLLTRYFRDNTLRRYVGTTDTARLEPLGGDDAPLGSWAPRGSVILLGSPGRFVVRDLDAGTTAEVAVPRGAVHAWGADGRTLLVGRVSPVVAGGDVVDAFEARWPQAGGSVALPNVTGARSISPDGSHFVGVVRDGRHDVSLALYDCGPGAAALDAGAAARLARIDDGKGRLIRPAAGDIAQFLTPTHAGIDVAAPYGSLIVAADDGVVTAAGWHPNGGSHVCVQHAGGLETCYYHDSELLVDVGERVARGQPLALIGMTGIATGPHLHWEAHQDGRLVDPLSR